MIFGLGAGVEKNIFGKGLKIFNYYKDSNLISEPPREIRAARRLVWENWGIMGMAGAYARGKPRQPLFWANR